VVTESEHDLCDAILAAFNEVAGTDYRAADFRRGIIGRIRERPDLDAAAHRELIERNFASPWWKGSASPAVIYGKTQVFENCLNTRPQRAYTHERVGQDRSIYNQGRQD